MLFSRPDGTHLRDLDPMRRMMPMIMPRRNEAIVYYEQIVDATAMLEFLDRWNAREEIKLTPLHLVIAALGRTLKARPQLDRFVAARRLWQRKDTTISFAAKKEFADHAPLKTVKLPVIEGEPLIDTARRIREEIGVGRASDDRPMDRELSTLDRLPGFMLGSLIRLARWLDRWNLLPYGLMKDDPLFSSVFVANLGSLGIDRVWHHLYDHGTVSVFCVIGALRPRLVAGSNGTPEMRQTLRLRFTLDERVCDGFYAAQSLEILRADLEDPTRFTVAPPPVEKRAQNALRSTL